MATGVSGRGHFQRVVTMASELQGPPGLAESKYLDGWSPATWGRASNNLGRLQRAPLGSLLDRLRTRAIKATVYRAPHAESRGPRHAAHGIPRAALGSDLCFSRAEDVPQTTPGAKGPFTPESGRPRVPLSTPGSAQGQSVDARWLLGPGGGWPHTGLSPSTPAVLNEGRSCPPPPPIWQLLETRLLSVGFGARAEAPPNTPRHAGRFHTRDHPS